jgi:nucleoid DNA-binding protein
VREKNPRRDRNPANGTSLILDERRVVTFKCSRSFRDKPETGQFIVIHFPVGYQSHKND